ncbi:predicted protein [Naegleria gruberi]|uniref:Predicted protein n=1 Tax=Naegleria gruberi TaxID=5762 RepID=D2V8U9_NAEGR|nr:uncharacterized protein NAEGRDRAFT_65290 [Naegleria gruberi]EFC46756.1 predicted protein [Naegleria gruberi]|eukprot:XP_002679500.1 predicted protein [Naegleria gruberi strain NEG-M]
MNNQLQQHQFKYYQYYFLSHCHSDHFKGLDDRFFQNASASDETCIVCHPITRNLLLALYPKLDKDRILAIDLLQPTLLTVRGASSKEPKHFMCTLLSSNHCPGSCMFLFEIAKPGSPNEVESILYCGDFRDPPSDTIQYLKSKKISKVYIDDTFCDPSNFLNLPKRSDSIKELIKLIEKERAKQRAVYIALDLLGTERVLFELVSHFKTKLFCDYENLNPKRRKEIDCMKSLKENIFTRDKEKTFIRVVSKTTIKSLAELLKKEDDCPLLICISTMFLKYLNKDTRGMSSSFDRGSSTYFQDGIFKILYSFHSSHKEILKFLEQVFGSNVKEYPSIISLNPHQTSSKNNKNLLDDIRKGTSSTKVEDDSKDYGFFSDTETLFKEEHVVIKDNFLETLIEKRRSSSQRDDEELFSSLETEPYTAIPEEDLDAEKLFEEFNSQQDELVTPTTSHPITFSLMSPFTPQPPSSQKKRLNSSSNDESFNMLNLSEDDNTPKQSEKKKKKLE